MHNLASPDNSDASVERQIQSKGLTAPRVTPAALKENIVSAHYFTALQGAMYPYRRANLKEEDEQALSLLTFCVLVLQNGFTVSGESACASAENFDAQIGRQIARQNAEQKIWPLMGYALKQQLSQEVA